MTQVAVYIENDRTWVVHPSPEDLKLYGMHAIAIKDVPAGLPFKIMNAADLPDRSERATWKIDPATLTNGVGGESSEYPPPKPEPDEKHD